MRPPLLTSILALLPGSAFAATLQVPATFPKLSDALAAAAPGDVIELAAGDYSNEGAQRVDISVQIVGTALASQVTVPPLVVGAEGNLTLIRTTLSCDPLLPGVEIEDNGATTLEEVQAVGCVSDASRIDAGLITTLVVRDSVFTDISSVSGAAVKMALGTSLTVERSDFTRCAGGAVPAANCLLSDCTGAIDAWSASVTISDSTFRDNTGETGGALALQAVSDLSIANTTFDGNDADRGAALYLRSFLEATLTDLVLVDNTTVTAAAVDLDGNANPATVRVERLRAEGNSGVDGAVLQVLDADLLEVYSAWICENVGGEGVDLSVEGVASVDVQGLLAAFTVGSSSVYLDASAATLTNNSFIGNGGDALFVRGTTAPASADLVNTLFADLGGSAADSAGVASGDVGGGFDTWGMNSDESNSGHDTFFYTGDALLQGYVDPVVTGCDDLVAWLRADSPLRDAGDNGILDLDGTLSDIGAYGGPWAWLADADADGSYEDLDCDEADPAIHPGALELPSDGVDQDCDGFDLLDVDGDGQVSLGSGGTDCDDLDADIFLGAAEIPYDGVDQDCDGADADDLDGDGWPAVEAGGTDCDDADPTIWPGTPEVWYDGVDQDCDGADDFDQDGDGAASAEHGGDDCNDRDATIHPAAIDTWYDGVDQDCDGWNDYDQDRDGALSEDFTGDDCDDTDPNVGPGVAETPYDGIDQDCSGDDLIDVDHDGFIGSAIGGNDCDDTDATVFPGAAEDLSTVDRNCDGWTDPVGDLRPRACSSSRGAPSILFLFGLAALARRRR